MRHPKTFAARLNLYVLSLTAFFFLCLGIIFYLYISRKETDNAHRMTLSQTETISLNLDLELQAIQDAIEKTSIKVFEYRDRPEMMKGIIEEMTARTDTIYGGGVAFEPGYFSEGDHLFMEYSYWKTDSTLVNVHFGNEGMNYLEKPWYKNAREARKGLWSPPYASGLEHYTAMITYSDPVYDEDGEIFAVVIADLALRSLAADLEKLKPYDGSYSFIIAQDGTYISHPDPSHILHENILFSAEPEIQKLGEKIVDGGKGTETITLNGKRHLASYSEILTTDSVVCCITPYSSILNDLGRLTFYVLLILCIGLLCLMGCMHLIVKKESAPVDIMEQDLYIARKIQKQMLPDISEVKDATDRVDIHAYLRPARDVGGDMYDFFIDDEKLYFAIGDVSGKGTPAALIMSIVKCFFRSCSKGKEKAEDIVGSMNASIMENNLSDMFVTLFIGILDLKKQNLSYCSAGHEPPFIFTQGQSPALLDGIRNFPIGIMKDSGYNGENIPFIPGDKIFIYTDGVTEAENIRQECLGRDAVHEDLDKHAETSVRDTTESILSMINAHAGNMGQSDDITMMCIKLIR